MPDEKTLEDHTVAELDELAEEFSVADYPASGNKAEKVEALGAAGVLGSLEPDEIVDEQPAGAPVYRLSLKKDWFAEGVEPTASFMVAEGGGTPRAIELKGNQTFETTDRSTWLGLRDVPFLEDEGEVE